MAACQPNQVHLQLTQVEKPKSLLVSNIWAITEARLWQTKKLNEYGVYVGGETFPFYYPYVCQQPIDPGRYTLVTTFPDHSYNWVVCESLGKRDETYKTPGGIIKTAEVESLRKLGVLRTDSCSELVLGSGRKCSILKQINALFV